MRPLDLLIGALFAGAIAVAARRAHALTTGGALAAFAVGTVTYACGTLGFTFVLLAFFVPSVVLSRVGKRRKRALVDIGKAGARDAMQVLANGGVATLCAAAWAFTYDVRWAAAFAGAYAAATADTWGTEIGTLARGAPRSILTGKRVATGISGGITRAGSLAEAAGSVWLALAGAAGIAAAYALGPRGNVPIMVFGEPGAAVGRVAGGIALGGIAGALIDSLLGASLQELRFCDACGRSCETDPHVCGAPTRLLRGVRGVSNDAVNLLATLTGAAVAFAVSR